MKVPTSKEMFQEREEANKTTNPIPQEVGRTDRAIWFYYISNFYSNFSLWVKPSPFMYDSPSFNSLSPRPLLEFFFVALRYWNRFEPSWYFLFQFSDYLPPEYLSIFISVGSLKKNRLRYHCCFLLTSFTTSLMPLQLHKHLTIKM